MACFVCGATETTTEAGECSVCGESRNLEPAMGTVEATYIPPAQAIDPIPADFVEEWS